MGICNCKECIEDFFKDNDILMENGEKKESREQKLKSSKNNNMEINNINIIDLEEKVHNPNQMEEEKKLLISNKNQKSNRDDLEPKDTDDIYNDKESNNQQQPQQREEMKDSNQEQKQEQEKEQEEEKDNKNINLKNKEKIPIDTIKKRLNTSPCVVNNIKTENLQTNQEMEKNQRDDEERVNNYGLDEPKEEILQHNYLSPNKFKVETYEPIQIRDNIRNFYNTSEYKTKTEDTLKKGPKDSLNPKCQVFPHKKKKKSFLSQNEPIDTDKKIQNYQNRHKSVDQGIKTLREFGPKDSQKKDEDNFNFHCDKQESTDYIYNNQNVGAINNADLDQMNYNQNNFININNQNNYIIQQQQYNNYQEGNNQQSYLPLIMNSIMNNNNNNLNGFQVYNNEEYFQNMQNNNNMDDY